MLNTAIKAAREAGRLINRYFDQVDRLTITQKARNDYVTEIDKASEEIIINQLKKAYPGHKMLAEESGGVDFTKEEWVWIIDPLDGTANFIHNIPHFAISIALTHHGQVEQAVIYDPIRNELFTASKGQGAKLNDHKIRVSQCTKLERALIATGFPFRNPEYFEQYVSIFKALFPKTGGMRRAGSAALDLAYVAAGRLDGYFEANLKPWDLAAGTLLIKEAGGIVSDFNGENKYLTNGTITVAPAKLHSSLLSFIQ